MDLYELYNINNKARADMEPGEQEVEYNME